MLTAYLVDRARRDAETLLLCPQFGTLAGAARSAAFGGCGRPRDFLAGRDSVVDPSPARACLANIVEAVWPLGAWWWWWCGGPCAHGASVQYVGAASNVV